MKGHSLWLSSNRDTERVDLCPVDFCLLQNVPWKLSHFFKKKVQNWLDCMQV